MMNACLKNEVVEGNLTIIEMMAELDKLRQENQLLKEENKGLHNIIFANQNIENTSNNNEDIGMLNEYEKEYLCGCESEENFDVYAEALNNCSVKAF